MRKIVILITMMCLSALMFAQNPGEIKGKIIDAKTKELLTGATIYVDYMGEKIATFADKDGRFTIKPLNPGTYNVYVVFLGYDTVFYPNIKVNSDKMTFLEDTYLEESKKGVVLDGFTIKGVKPIDPTSIKIIDAGALGAMPDGKNISTSLRNNFSDISVSDDGEEIYFRGSRNGDAVYYVDGVKSRDSDPHVPGCAIGSMAVYTGGVPANYGDFTGGVVVIETKSYYSWLNEKKARKQGGN